tara:strand:+ start:76 stop:567 length:492 start_codon:yes stop_codon:yes gene_type:complete
MSNDRDERRRAYREANKEAISEYNKAYSKANKGAISERKKAYYEENKESLTVYRKGYYQANKEAFVEQQRAYCLSPAGKFKQIKATGIQRGRHFDLPYEFYESQLWGKPCHYCGCEIEVTGLDRKDNDKGYTPDNVVPCCRGCNRKKQTKPYEQYLLEIEGSK